MFDAVSFWAAILDLVLFLVFWIKMLFSLVLVSLS